MTFLDHLSGLLHLNCSQVTTDHPRVRSLATTEHKGVNTIMTNGLLSFLYQPVKQVTQKSRFQRSKRMDLVHRSRLTPCRARDEIG